MSVSGLPFLLGSPWVTALPVGFVRGREKRGSCRILFRVRVSFRGTLSSGFPGGAGPMASGCVYGMAPLPVCGSHDWGEWGLLGGLAFWPASSSQDAHTGCLWDPGPQDFRGQNVGCSCCHYSDPSFLPFYWSAHTPLLSVFWNLLKPLSHCCEG